MQVVFIYLFHLCIFIHLTFKIINTKNLIIYTIIDTWVSTIICSWFLLTWTRGGKQMGLILVREAAIKVHSSQKWAAKNFMDYHYRPYGGVAWVRLEILVGTKVVKKIKLSKKNKQRHKHEAMLWFVEWESSEGFRTKEWRVIKIKKMIMWIMSFDSLLMCFKDKSKGLELF